MSPQISVVIITLGRQTLYRLVSKLLNQEISCEYEIILISQSQLNEDLLQDNKIEIFNKKPNLGYSYYRNLGIQHSKGDIIAFIDDDEEPMDEHWLDELTLPIITQKELVTTAGYHIPLGQGYLADSISFLGFPGGGFVGFETMWHVDERRYTRHICTGNLAIKKALLERLGGFDETLKHGSEDVYLGEILVNNDIKIKYVGQATVFHDARSGLVNIMKWNIRRGKSAYELGKKKQIRSMHLKGRITSSIKILQKAIFTKYFPAVALLMVMQYFSQLLGYWIRQVSEANNKQSI